MLYKPEWKWDWWEYCPWVIHQYLDLMLECIKDDDVDDKARESLLSTLTTYVANYVRRDYGEASYIWNELESMYHPRWPYGTNIRYYLGYIQSMCEQIIKEHQPNDDYPDTYRY